MENLFWAYMPAMGYIRSTALAVLALAVSIPLWTQNRPWRTLVHTLPTLSVDESTQPTKWDTSHTHSRLANVEVLFVLDPNFYLCWESINLDNLAMSSLIPWLLQLKDSATQTYGHPAGNALEVKACWLP